MTTAHLATIPDRESTLKQVLESIVPYVDHTFVALNSYNHVPTWFDELKTVTYRIFDNSLGDAFKFAFMGEVNGLSYICDDDLIYNSFYFSLLQYKVNQYKCPVSLHGKKYTLPFRGFKYFSENYRCLNNVFGDHPVDVIGTGTLAFDTSMVGLSLSDFKSPNIADIWFSKICHEQKVPLMVTEHKAGIVGYLHPKTTIWQNTKDYSLHNRIIKDFLK